MSQSLLPDPELNRWMYRGFQQLLLIFWPEMRGYWFCSSFIAVYCFFNWFSFVKLILFCLWLFILFLVFNLFLVPTTVSSPTIGTVCILTLNQFQWHSGQQHRRHCIHCLCLSWDCIHTQNIGGDIELDLDPTSSTQWKNWFLGDREIHSEEIDSHILEL